LPGGTGTAQAVHGGPLEFDTKQRKSSGRAGSFTTKDYAAVF